MLFFNPLLMLAGPLRTRAARRASKGAPWPPLRVEPAGSAQG